MNDKIKKYTQKQIDKAHKHTIFNHSEILQSRKAVCFYCGFIFDPNNKEVALEWTDYDNPKGLTALCPMCGIDCVIGTASGFPVDDPDFIKQATEEWFGGYSRISSSKPVEKVKWINIEVE
ncbi:MAG: hypothetical protein RBT69_06010 [Spirochaetia bacterium]|nr:hypothetical protein [Spirochaetia bacterium]